MDFHNSTEEEVKSETDTENRKHFFCTLSKTAANAGLVIVDCEPRDQSTSNSVHIDQNQLYFYMQSTVHQFSVQNSRSELIDLAVAAVSDITGFDRVMLYYFDADWHGQVLSEHINEEYVGKVDSYMGLHFPATDIPKQAR